MKKRKRNRKKRGKGRGREEEKEEEREKEVDKSVRLGERTFAIYDVGRCDFGAEKVKNVHSKFTQKNQSPNREETEDD